MATPKSPMLRDPARIAPHKSLGLSSQVPGFFLVPINTCATLVFVSTSIHVTTSSAPAPCSPPAPSRYPSPLPLHGPGPPSHPSYVSLKFCSLVCCYGYSLIFHPRPVCYHGHYFCFVTGSFSVFIALPVLCSWSVVVLWLLFGVMFECIHVFVQGFMFYY